MYKRLICQIDNIVDGCVACIAACTNRYLNFIIRICSLDVYTHLFLYIFILPYMYLGMLTDFRLMEGKLLHVLGV